MPSCSMRFDEMRKGIRAASLRSIRPYALDMLNTRDKDFTGGRYRMVSVSVLQRRLPKNAKDLETSPISTVF